MPHTASTLLQTPEGDPIHEVQIQANRTTIESQIRTVLENGPHEIIAAMTTLRSKLPAIQTLTVRIDAQGDKRIATMVVTAELDTDGSSTTPTAHSDELTQEQAPPTRFQTSEGKPIHEIHIQGNQKIIAAEIQTALENGPEDIVKAIASLPLPDFNRVVVEIKGDDTRRVATIIVIAQPDVSPLPTASPTELWTAARDPIHEIRIQGNQQSVRQRFEMFLKTDPRKSKKRLTI